MEPMNVRYYLGWALLAAAFLAAASEVLVRTITGTTHLVVSARELWYTLWPGSLLIAQLRVEAIAPVLWEPVILTILAFPAWALFGVPGCVMIGLYRRTHPGDWQKMEEARQLENQLALFDDLTREAREQGMYDATDMEPDYTSHDLLDRLEAEYREEIGREISTQEEFDAMVRQAGIEPRPRPNLDAPDAADAETDEDGGDPRAAATDEGSDTAPDAGRKETG